MSDSPPQGLTCRQAEVFEVIESYYSVMGEPCPVRALARRFQIHHTTAQRFIRVLNRKGWLESSGQAVPARHASHLRQFGG